MDASDVMKDIKTAVSGAVSKYNILDKVQKIGLNARSSWMSSKLGVTLAVVLGLLYLAHGQVGPLLDTIKWVVCTFLVVRGIQDTVQARETRLLQSHALDLFAKDGLTTGELDQVIK
jgi:hypothetical protein